MSKLHYILFPELCILLKWTTNIVVHALSDYTKILTEKKHRCTPLIITLHDHPLVEIIIQLEWEDVYGGFCQLV